MGKRIQEHESNGTIVLFNEHNKIVDSLYSTIFEEEIDHLDLISSFDILTGRGKRLPQNLIIIFKEPILPRV